MSSQYFRLSPCQDNEKLRLSSPDLPSTFSAESLPASTKTYLLPPACRPIPITLDCLCINPFQLATQDSPQHGGIAALSFAVIDYDYILNEPILLKGNLYIALITELWLNEDTSNSVNSSVECQSIRSIRIDRHGSGCFVYVRRDLSTSFLTQPTLELIQESEWPAVMVFSCVLQMACI